MGKLLGYRYYNQVTKKAILKYCNSYNLDPEEILKINRKAPNKCIYCGKELLGKGRFTKKFCNSSCSASFNNKNRTHSDVTKDKIGRTLSQKTESTKTRVCKVCGKEFIIIKNKYGKFSRTHTCSKECLQKLKSASNKKAMEKIIAENRHLGWQTRNIISYPEKFWMEILDNNSIKYTHNFYIKKYHYFLDFLITVGDYNVDLEIDGKQHKYGDRKEHDAIRDFNLKNDGYVVYRIDWNEINSDNGKSIMKDKIVEFLNFYKELYGED